MVRLLLPVSLFLLLLGISRGAEGSFTLTWDDNSNNEAGFRIERAIGTGPFVEIATVARNVTRYVDPSVVVGAIYSYRVRAYNQSGVSAYSNLAANVPVSPVIIPATIARAPVSSAAIVAGGDTTFSVEIEGNPPPTIQWQVSRDGGATWTNVPNAAPYSGATTTTLTLSGASAALDRNQYRAVVTNQTGSATSTGVTLSVLAPPRLANLSIRALAGTASDTLIVGFVVGGGAKKSLLVRGVGPSLASFGVTSPLADPVLSLFEGARLVESNDGWGSATNRDLVLSTGAAVGAFGLPAGSRDAALLSQVNPGASSAQIAGKAGTVGTALLELYDADPHADGHLVNFSARSFVGPVGNAPIVGFVVTGSTPLRVLIRGVGPTLATLGVGGVLADPQLLLYRQGSSTPIQQNNDWGGSEVLRTAFTATGAFALPNTSRDAALLLTLDPGAYTVQLLGVNNSTGVALIEVYEAR